MGCRNSANSHRSRSESRENVDNNDSGRERSQNERSNREKKREQKQTDDSEDNNADPNVTPHSTDRRYTFWSSNAADNIEMLKEACDFNAPKTKGFANKLAGKATNSDGTFNIEQLCEIFDYCRQKWSYVNDPKGSEYLAKASETISSNLTGDCDDFAVLISTCMLAIGGDICIITAQGPQGGHAYAEVDISHMNLKHVGEYIHKRFKKYKVGKLQVRNEGSHIWLNLDWQAAYPGGPLFTAHTRVSYYCIDGYWTNRD